jgi:hypothetical protein
VLIKGPRWWVGLICHHNSWGQNLKPGSPRHQRSSHPQRHPSHKTIVSSLIHHQHTISKHNTHAHCPSMKQRPCGRLQQATSRPLALSTCYGQQHQRRCRLAVCCTAQPSNGSPSPGSARGSDSSSRSNSPSVAVQEVNSSAMVRGVLGSSLDASGQLPDQLSARLVVVGANSSTSTVVVSAAVSPDDAETAVETAAAAVADAEEIAAAGEAAAAAAVAAPWPAGPVPLEGLPSPRAVDASLNSSLTSFSRCAVAAAVCVLHAWYNLCKAWQAAACQDCSQQAWQG